MPDAGVACGVSPQEPSTAYLIAFRIGGTCALQRRAVVALISVGLLLAPHNGLGCGLAMQVSGG